MSGSAKLRHRLLILLGPVLIAAVAGWYYLQGGRLVSTDNAYVKASMTSVTSEISGRVVEVLSQENQHVEQGQTLLRLDEQPFRIAFARANANLANVRSQVESLKADYFSRQVDLDNVKTDVAFRKKELERARQLRERESISESRFDEIQYAWQSTRSELQAKKQDLGVVEAKLVDHRLPTEKHPSYQQALAELEKARLDLERLSISAPVAGTVSQISLYPGEHVTAGAPLFSLVEEGRVWLEANFKETDLTHMRVGQKATVTLDTYPDREWEAQVSSITPATGAEFSLLPAQNSSGNWVKVVQRITVRLELTEYQEDLPFYSGMSAHVTVDTEHQREFPWSS